MCRFNKHIKSSNSMKMGSMALVVTIALSGCSNSRDNSHRDSNSSHGGGNSVYPWWVHTGSTGSSSTESTKSSTSTKSSFFSSVGDSHTSLGG